MAVSGLPEPCTTHAKNIARLALDMMDKGKSIFIDSKPVVSKCVFFFYLTWIYLIIIFKGNHNWNPFR